MMTLVQETARLGISATANRLTTVERFAGPAASQQDFADAARRRVESAWLSDPSFAGALLLRDRDDDRGGIACYAQWTKPAGTAPDSTPPLSVPDSWSLRETLNSCEVLESRTYRVAFTQRRDNTDAPVSVALPDTPFAHFGMFTVAGDGQEKVLDLARLNAPNSFATPGLSAVDFHYSLDGTHVLNLGVWSTFDSFDTLLRQPGFRDENPYWDGAATFQPAFFDVVAVYGRP